MNSNTEVAVVREHFERFRGVTLQMLDMIPEEKLRLAIVVRGHPTHFQPISLPAAVEAGKM